MAHADAAIADAATAVRAMMRARLLLRRRRAAAASRRSSGASLRTQPTRRRGRRPLQVVRQARPACAAHVHLQATRSRRPSRVRRFPQAPSSHARRASGWPSVGVYDSLPRCALLAHTRRIQFCPHIPHIQCARRMLYMCRRRAATVAAIHCMYHTRPSRPSPHVPHSPRSPSRGRDTLSPVVPSLARCALRRVSMLPARHARPPRRVYVRGTQYARVAYPPPCAPQGPPHVLSRP